VCLLVSFELTGAESGQTVLVLPSGYGPVKFLYRYLANIECSNAEAKIDIDFAHHSCCISHRPGVPLRITYTVQKPRDEIFGRNLFYNAIQGCFAPIFERRYFHILGVCLFLYPEAEGQYDITIRWSGFPNDWTMLNSIAPEKGNQQQFIACSKVWLESAFLGGDYRLNRILVSQKAVFIAIRGHWLFDDRELIEFLKASMQSIRDFWNDHDFEHYTVVLNPVGIDKLSSKDSCPQESVEIGSGLLNAMVLFSTPDRTLQQLGRLIYHEQLHHWIGGKIRAGDDEADYLYAWFNEGFTEYLTYKLMVKDNLLTLAQYIGILNQKFLRPYYSSSYRELPNDVIADNIDSNQGYLDLAYQRGCLIAFYLDMKIRESSGYSDDIRFLLLDVLSHYHKNNVMISDDLKAFFGLLEKHVLKDFCAEDFYQRHIVDGKLIPAAMFCLPGYLIMRDSEVPEIEVVEEALFNAHVNDLV
jgi:predicted metalloprotease with PDZ domain